jgi:hypothetical protein
MGKTWEIMSIKIGTGIEYNKWILPRILPLVSQKILETGWDHGG